MYDSLTNKGEEAVTDLCEHINAVVLLHLLVGFHEFRDVAITKLLDNIVVFATFHDVNEADDVRVVHWLHDFYLLEKGAFQVFVRVDWNYSKLTCVFLDHLYSHLLVSCVWYPCVNTSVCASTQARIHSNLVTVNLLYTHLLNLDNYISYYYTIMNLNYHSKRNSNYIHQNTPFLSINSMAFLRTNGYWREFVQHKYWG